MVKKKTIRIYVEIKLEWRWLAENMRKVYKHLNVFLDSLFSLISKGTYYVGK